MISRTPALVRALVLAFIVATPLAAAEPTGDCQVTGIGLVCVGDYTWTEGDEGCQGDSIHEEGTGVWAETVAGDATASGFAYCNVFYDSSYHEEGVRVRVDADAVFLEISWNTWSYEDPTQTLAGCSLWVYYVGPVYGYYNNIGCPAGQDPPDQNWGDLLP